MKKFRFKLQTVLDQRKAKEDHLLAELGEVRREEAAEAARLTRLRGELEAARAGMVAALAGNARPEELARRDEYVKTMRDDARVQELTLEAVRARAEAKRLEVVEAMKERKVLESLRDKQEREYVQACERAEQQQMDEMASVRYARGM